MDYNVTFRGEDGTIFTRTCNASSPDRVLVWADEMYPEARVLDVFDPAERAADIYRRAEMMYDDDYYYDD